MQRDEAQVDESNRLILQGLVHQVVVKPNKSDYDPVALFIERGTDITVALLSQEHVNALHSYLGQFVK